MPNIPLPSRNLRVVTERRRAGMTIDADGANGQTGGVPVYAPKGFTPAALDFLANAGGPGNWFGVVTDTGKKDGKPVKQNASGPAPGRETGARPAILRFWAPLTSNFGQPGESQNLRSDPDPS